MKLILLFSHKLTDEQIREAENELKVEEFIYLPQELQYIWSNIPPEGELPIYIIDKFKRFIIDNAKQGDYILIQGDFGATNHMVQWAKEKGFVPIYATSKREYKSITNEDGSITNVHIFRHINFRRY
ncbi:MULTISPECIES: CRISPR-associated protein Csx20 [Caloramator]|uniref:Uncharacterized protein n=1 Tax=Caloramator proteoclasticus DSM 10124 TaxID=1121262 RepID=A0A1M4YHB6_9CLOT|nr:MULTISPECIES: CRISPR-associated protein Csx20 [Caloramator]SHF05110.1 hypothetical protein SAMN02746091_01659 [Caloramator proteoclasticus DSM 10124]